MKFLLILSRRLAKKIFLSIDPMSKSVSALPLSRAKAADIRESRSEAAIPTIKSMLKVDEEAIIPPRAVSESCGSKDPYSNVTASVDVSTSKDAGYSQESFGEAEENGLIGAEEDLFSSIPGWYECMNTTMASAAHHAAFYGYSEVLEELSRLFDVFALDDKGRTPLFYAALRNQIACVTFLISIGAGVHIIFNYWSMLIFAFEPFPRTHVDRSRRYQRRYPAARRCNH